MKHSRLAKRRVTVGLLAAAVGLIGSFGVATAPTNAAVPTVALTSTRPPRTTPPPSPKICVANVYEYYFQSAGTWYYYGDVAVTNTSTVTTYNWVLSVTAPQGTTWQAWNVQEMPEYGAGWYRNVSFNGAIPAGGNTHAGFLLILPPGYVVGSQPVTFGCTIF